MPHASIGPSRALPPTRVRRCSAAPQHRPTRRASDIVLADAVAHAIRTVPGVAELSLGLVTPVATYGPGRSVAGVIIRHPTFETLAIEVHVVLSEIHCTRAATAAVAGGARDQEENGPITEVANLVRCAVRHSTRELTSSDVARVDVYIDDLR